MDDFEALRDREEELRAGQLAGWVEQLEAGGGVLAAGGSPLTALRAPLLGNAKK